MIVRRAYRHKLRLTAAQHEQCGRFAGCARLIYNAGLQQRRLGYEVTGRSLRYKAQTYFLKEVKADPQWSFLREAPAHVLQQALLDVDRAYTNFFEGRARFPRFRRRGERDSFRFPDAKQIGAHHPARQGQVRLPKLGWVSVTNCYPRLNGRLFEGRLLNVTVSRRADGWYASFACELETEESAAATGGPVGLDLGVTTSVASSDGELISLPGITDREWEKIGLLQRTVAGRRKGSRNREKATAQLARKRQRLAARKRDQIHKLTTHLTREHETIVIEDLKVKNMTRSAKGTLEQPGNRVTQKAGLNRAMLDQAWGEIRRQLNYKTGWNGGQLIVVNPRNTSRMCAACGHIAPENRESQAVFWCVACGHKAHADLNAARNILARGLSSNEVRTLGTREPAPDGANACAHERALKTPERARPSRKAPAQAQARNQATV